MKSPRGNYIITDAWNEDSFLGRVNWGYIHKVHLNKRNDFGYGIDTTSKIESIWTELKMKIKK